MDPDVTYTRLAEFFAQPGKCTDEEFEQAREWWEALDGWLKLGGHAPAAWDQRLRSRGR